MLHPLIDFDLSSVASSQIALASIVCASILLGKFTSEILEFDFSKLGNLRIEKKMVLKIAKCMLKELGQCSFSQVQIIRAS